MSALNSPDQLGMIIPFSKEIIGPAGVFVHVLTCPDCFKAGAEWCRLEATNAAYRLHKIGGCDIQSVSHTFGNLTFLCSSGLLVRRLTNIWMERTLFIFFVCFFCESHKVGTTCHKETCFQGCPHSIFSVHDRELWAGLQHEGCVWEGCIQWYVKDTLGSDLYCPPPPYLHNYKFQLRLWSQTLRHIFPRTPTHWVPRIWSN